MRYKVKTTLLAIPISFFLIATFYLHLFREIFPPSIHDTSPMPPPIKLPTNHPHNLIIHNLPAPTLPRLHPTPSLDTVLLPDSELLLLLPPQTPSPNNLSCLFQNNLSSPARAAGILSSARSAFCCAIPPTLRRLKHPPSPRLIAPSGDEYTPKKNMIWWNRLVYESISTPSDVIVFAKGVNNRQGVNRATKDLRCVFLVDNTIVATTTVTSSYQEVFRCSHPTVLNSTSITVSLQVKVGNGSNTLPSLAVYRSPPSMSKQKRSTICACTMVLNVAKFLREWVVYHSSIGVERFILYDNGSEDELEGVVRRLSSEGFNVTTRIWPWPKTQEAGFSHSAVFEQDSCQWTAYVDLDEFIFSPAWSSSIKPNRSMLASLLPSGNGSIGQVSLPCRDFGPSGQRAHPAGGVTQGYTCRVRAEERHKSIVRLDSVDGSLVNSIHHFGLGKGWKTQRAGAVVNHYKFQAWEEFKVKFNRRVSAYVADWREAVNPGSRDRTPGLGYEPVEPEGWAVKFCEMNDTRLRDTTRRWFGAEGPAEQYKLSWED